MKHLMRFLSLMTLVFFLVGCNQSKLTVQQENALGEQEAREVLSEVKLSRSASLNSKVKRVGKRIAKVSERPEFQWKYYVVDNPTTFNAFVLPGGKIFVYSGLFKYAKTDAELATVIAHEVAHALKSHGVIGSQRAKAAQTLGGLLDIGMAVAGVDSSVASLANTAYNYGATLGYLRPHSREHELEADSIGLMLMAKAGYNPNAAISFWKKFGKASSGTPEYLSTHPAPGNRIANLQKLMPKALKLYQTR
jgi:predicted Zn-dependent protease